MPRFNNSVGRQKIVTLTKKKKSLADAVNEQLTLSALGGGRSLGDEDGQYTEGGVAEDFDYEGTHHRGSDDEGGACATSDTNGRRSGASTSGSAKAKQLRARDVLKSNPSGRLRHRGPLDASFSEGKYAAKPVNVEAAMDDIFGALDMGDIDAEGDELYDGSDAAGDSQDNSENRSDEGEKSEALRGRAATKQTSAHKRRRAKDLTEEEYTAWVEKKKSKQKASGFPRGPLSFGGDLNGEADGSGVSNEEADILRQLNELRNTQMNLVSAAGGADGDDAAAGVSGVSGKVPSAAGSALADAKHAREVVQHFIMVYSQLLRLRVLFQPAVTKAIRMPQYYARSLFVEADPEVDAAVVAEASAALASTTGEARAERALAELQRQREEIAGQYAELQDDLEHILSTLFAVAVGSASDSPTSESHSAAKAKKFKTEGMPLSMPSYDAIERYHKRALNHANTCLDYWGSKLVQANGAKLKTIAQPLPQQIAAILTAKTRLRSKVQKNRSHLAILAHPEHIRASASAEVKAQRVLHIAEGDVDEEVYDDADFLRELVRRGGAVANQLEQRVQEMQKALLPSREGARKGFHRMTKGKAINYEPRPKLVGFMMAETLENTERNDVVVQNLFQ